MAETISKHKIYSYKELVDYIKTKVVATQEISLKNLEWNFPLDFNELLRDCGFAKIVIEDDQCPEIEADAIPITISNIICSTLSFIGIRFKSHLYITGIASESQINSLHIACCQFPLIEEAPPSFGLSSLNLNELVISDCDFGTSVNILSIKVLKTGTIEITDCRFKNSITLGEIDMPKQESKLVCIGDTTEVTGDFRIVDCLIAGEVNIGAIIHGNLLVYSIDYSLEKGRDITTGNLYINKFCLHETTVDKAIRFMNCSFRSIDILNSQINNVYEYNLKYNILRNDTPIIFRDAAIKNNNEFLIQKYTATIYDRRLRNETVSIIKGILNPRTKKENNKEKWYKRVRGFLYTVIWEPIILLIISLFSGERLLLWFNKYSNNYNRSWTRGIWFTAIITLIFYFLLNYCGLEKPFFIIDWKFHNFGNVSEGYLKLIDIFNLSDSIVDFHPTSLGKYIMFVSKIFIAFGIYQTIYAFYKYRK